METKSIITDWMFDGQFVWGYEPSTKQAIRTSTIKRIFSNQGKVYAETQNSMYELIAQEG